MPPVNNNTGILIQFSAFYLPMWQIGIFHFIVVTGQRNREPSTMCSHKKMIKKIQVRNPRLKFFHDVCDILKGKGGKQILGYRASPSSVLKYCPIHSVMLKGPSRHLKILVDNRKSLLSENLEKYVVVYCNSNTNKISYV